MLERSRSPSDAPSERPMVKLRPLEDVYSYFIFTMPIEERISPGSLTWNKTLSFTLVFVALFLQGVMLLSIYKVVVAGHQDWQAGIVLPEQEDGACNPGGSLCFMTKDKQYSCAPPTVQLSGRWEELDTDGDGVWTKDEVIAAKEDLQCKYVVDPVEVFNVFAKFLIMREKVIWIHPDIKAFKAIPKPYFTYAQGDVIMCGYRNEAMCPNLLERGIFDEPLKNGNAPRVGETIESAMKYCQDLLTDGGICERNLPSTYSVWRMASADQCGGGDYSKMVYKHPDSGMTKSMLKVDYNARKSFHRAEGSSGFLIYKIVVVILFLIGMFVEFKHITIMIAWLISFPSARRFGMDAVQVVQDESDPEAAPKYIVQGVQPKVRIMVAVLTAIRMFFVIIALWVGVVFLCQQTNELDLLLNGLGMIFIVDLLGLVFAWLLDEDAKEQVSNTEPMEFPAGGWWSRYPALRQILWFSLLLVTCGILLAWDFYYITKPTSHALECACLSQGKDCFEAHQFSNEFWDSYWGEQVPAVFADVDQLRGEYNRTRGGGAIDMLARRVPERRHMSTHRHQKTSRLFNHGPW